MGRIRYIAIAWFAAIALSLCAACAPVESGQPASAASGLDPGSYSVQVTLSGGSGRASVESPARLEVAEGGSMTATVVWSSSSYDLMVVDGGQYRPTSTEGGSAFDIPVAALGEDLPVQAETTAMSQPHLIDYTLRFEQPQRDARVSADADARGQASGEGEAPVDEETGEGASASPQTDFRNADVGTGWQVESSMPLAYATQFTVDYFADGYKLLCLSDGSRYLVVPEGRQAPDGLAGDIVVLHQPLGDIYLAASDTMCLFDALGAVDAITVSGISQDNWAVPAAVQAMESGRIAYGGKYSMPDYEMLLAKGCRLAIESTMINHTPQVRDKLVELGIPVFTERSSYESHPLGRAEWVKLYGAMLGEEDRAQALFDDQVRAADSIDAAQGGKTVAYFSINSNGAAVVRKPGDYIAKMISMAGGEYAFSSLADDGGSTVTLEMERFYAQAKDADVIVYNATIDSSVASMEDLLAKNGQIADFKAVRDGNVWITRQDMYQNMMSTGDIIADFNRMLTGARDGLTYLGRLE